MTAKKQDALWTDAKRWLLSKGFCIGTTKTGWAAVNRSGIVVTVSPSRTKIEWDDGAGCLTVSRADEIAMPWLQRVMMEAETTRETVARALAKNGGAS
jgi:hypothetical protein